MVGLLDVFEAIDDGQKKFGFTAADWFDVICMALNKVFENYSQETRVNVDDSPMLTLVS